MQVRLLCVAEPFREHAEKVAERYRAAGLRVSVESGERIAKLIRSAEKAKTPVMCVVGEKEVAEDTLAVRTYAGGEEAGGSMGSAEEEKEWADVKVEALKSELARWESYLTDNDDWLVPAASFSAADVAVAVLVLAIQRFGASLEGFPKLQKYAAKAAARESVASSWPPHWKEGEGPGFIKGML